MFSSMEVIIFLIRYYTTGLAKALDLTIDSNAKEESENGGGQDPKFPMSLATTAQIYTQNNYLAETDKLAENH